MADNKVIILRCSDGQTFEVDESIAIQSQTIKCMIEDDGANNPIRLPIVTGIVMSKVLEYCNKHAESYAEKLASNDVSEPSYPLVIDNAAAAAAAAEDPELKAWDAKFVEIFFPALAELFMAADYLNIKDLLDLTNRAIADKIKDQELLKAFQIALKMISHQRRKSFPS